MKRFLFALILVILSAAALAENNIAICPSAKELHMDGKQHWWATRTVKDVHGKNRKLKLKWYSTSPSLAKGIDYFAGAQYLGSSEGHIACIYMPKVSFRTQDFPIQVYFENLVIRPKGGKWQTKGKNQGQLNCISGDPSECPYLIYEPDFIDNPYDALRRLD
jgi:hypothetical protein